MRVALTGASGFLGWHVRCHAYALGVECVPVSREALADPVELAATVNDVDAVIHCAGAHRGSDDEVRSGILGPAQALRAALDRAGRPVRVVYPNSTHGRDATVYGAAKRQAAEILTGTGGLSEVMLPNLFGEHGRPFGRSVVATFCRQLVDGHRPRVLPDQELALVHVGDAARVLLTEAGAPSGHRVVDLGRSAERVAVSRVLRRLIELDRVYRTGELPDFADPFGLRLFHTYRSHVFPARTPIVVQPHHDGRGRLVECVRTGSAGGQAFVSTTEPGAHRGDHVHLRKFERFLVLAGEVEIALRRLFTDEVVRFRVSGDNPSIVDLPTLWAHRLTNHGEEMAVTFCWTNELFNPADPDTIACPVDTLVGAA